MTGDPKRIEDVVKRVDALVNPIEEVMLVIHWLSIMCRVPVFP